MYKLTLLFIFVYCLSYGQNGSISGMVLDNKSNIPLANTNIILLGTNKGANSGKDGKFLLSNITPGRYEIKFSFLGYKSYQKTI